jgi:hypothetical protein
VLSNAATQVNRRNSLQYWTTYAACALLLVQWSAYNFVDIDLWHQMALIRESLAAGHLLRSDPYAYTPTLPWIDHEWGAGALAFLFTKSLGGRGILVLKWFCALGTLLASIRCAEARGADFRTIGACAPLALFLSSLGFLATVRPQDYSFFFTAIWLLFLEYDHRRSRLWIPAALALFVLWLNLHAGFVMALGLTAIQAVESGFRREPYRHLILLLCAMGLETFVNPYGATFFLYLKRGLFMPRPYSPEWEAVSHLGPVWVGAFALAVLVALVSAWSAGWLQARGLLWLGATAIVAAMHRKLLPFFAITWLCYVPSYVQATQAGRWWRKFADRRRKFLTAAWAVVACVCVYVAWSERVWQLQVPQPLYPVGAVQYLSEHRFEGNLMVPFRAGAYVSWKLYPAVKVSLDSRYEVAYPNEAVRKGFEFYAAAPGWQATLTDWPTDAVLLPRDSLVARVMPSTGWPRVYADHDFEVYLRPGTSMTAEDRSTATFRGVFP